MADNNWPAWYYDPKTGKGKIFQKKDDVPKGWTDDPYAHERDSNEADPNAPDSNKGLAKAHGLTKAGMVKEFKEHEIAHDPKASADDLAVLFLATFDIEGEDEGEPEPDEGEE